MDGQTPTPTVEAAADSRFLSFQPRFTFRNTVLALILLLVFAGGVLVLHQSYNQKKNVETTMIDNAQAYSEAIATFRSLYTSEVVETLRSSHDIAIKHDYDPSKGEIPLPATLSIKLGESMSKLGSNVHSRLYSPYPFPWRLEEGGLRGKFAKAAWAALTADPDQPYYAFETVDGRKSLRCATADRMRNACIDCHNNHDQTPKKDWKVGDLRGVVEVVLPIDRPLERAESGVQQSLALFAIFGVVAVTGLGIVVGRLRSVSEQLEEQVQERTSELSRANDKLSNEIAERKRIEQDREALISQLESKNEELEQFTYTVSHGLKSPLITIAGFVDTLERSAVRGDLDTLRSDVTCIQNAAKRMKELLDEVLHLSRAGRFVNAFEDVDLGGLVEEVLHLCSEQIEQNGIEVNVTADPPMVHADRIRMREVIQNLIDNAVRHMGEQPNPRIEIGVRRDGEETVCFVLDNGMGIAPEYHEKVFGLFEKLDADGPGTGVGLAIVKRIVEVHNCRIWVESDGKGQGSRFCFTVEETKSPSPSEKVVAS
jgi:signal transduction histidine kinase